MSTAAMIGSARLCPGEAALAHHGVLFLDELPNSERDVLESLRRSTWSLKDLSLEGRRSSQISSFIYAGGHHKPLSLWVRHTSISPLWM